MDEKEKLVLQHNHDLLVENIDPFYIRQFLLEHGVIQDRTYLDSEHIRQHRVEKMLKLVKDKSSFDTFVKALLYIDSYKFLAEKLLHDKENPPTPSMPNLECARRFKSIQFRNKLEQCIYQNDKSAFHCFYRSAVDNWESLQKHHMHNLKSFERQELADMYFMAIDAEIERRQYYSDVELHDSDLFEKLDRISCQTTNPTLPVITRLARFSEALLLGGFEPKDSVSYTHQAKAFMTKCRIPNCRETGIVLRAEFHIEFYVNGLNGTFNKETLIALAEEAMKHFKAEADIIDNYSERVLFMEMALVYLGIGLYLNFVEERNYVGENDIQLAESIIETIITEDILLYLELRTKMNYYCIKSRISQLRTDKEKSLQYATKSLTLAEQGNFKTEKKNIENNIQDLKRMHFFLNAI